MATATMVAPLPTTYQVVMLPINQLVPSGHNVRHCLGDADDDISIAQLAESLRTEGLLQPPNVIQHPNKDGEGVYEVVAGMRRVRAAKNLGWSEIPCRVHDGMRDARTVSLMENLHRKPMRKQDMCRIVSDLLTATEGGNDIASVAHQLHLGHTTVRRYALLGNTLDDEVLDRLDQTGEARLTLDEAESMARDILRNAGGAGVLEDDITASSTTTEAGPTAEGEQSGGEAAQTVVVEPVKKRKPNIKKEPWVYNSNDEAINIPPPLWAEFASRIVTSGLAT
jgi:ParB/RepB/Spo0J family partition protein